MLKLHCFKKAHGGLATEEWIWRFCSSLGRCLWDGVTCQWETKKVVFCHSLTGNSVGVTDLICSNPASCLTGCRLFLGAFPDFFCECHPLWQRFGVLGPLFLVASMTSSFCLLLLRKGVHTIGRFVALLSSFYRKSWRNKWGDIFSLFALTRILGLKKPHLDFLSAYLPLTLR